MARLYWFAAVHGFDFFFALNFFRHLGRSERQANQYKDEQEKKSRAGKISLLCHARSPEGSNAGFLRMNQTSSFYQNTLQTAKSRRWVERVHAAFSQITARCISRDVV